MLKDYLEVNGTRYPVKVHIERRDDSRASISRRAVNIRLPNLLNREQRFREIHRIKGWAKEQIAANPERFKPKAQKTYADGVISKVGDEESVLRIEFMEKESSSARIIGNKIHMIITSRLSETIKNNHISTLISRCAARRRLPKLKAKIDGLNNRHFNQNLKKIFFKHNKSNWGSCSEDGNINISTRLLFAPDDILEYVCIHELAHLIEHNHSDRFWALVEKAMPDYREKQSWLKENGGECSF